MLLNVIVVIVCTLISILALGIVGYFAYRYGYNKGHNTGYKIAEEKYKLPQLTPEQVEVKERRERFEDHFNRLFAYKSPTRR